MGEGDELYPEMRLAVRLLRWIKARPGRRLLMPVFGLFVFFIVLPMSLLRYLIGSAER